MGKDILSLAVQHHEAGRLAKAERLYRSVLKSSPNHPVALNLLGVLAYQSGQHTKAIHLIKKAISASPKYAFAHFNLGNVLKFRGRLPEAEAAFNRAVAINPADAGAQGNLGIVLQDQGRHTEAEQAFRRSVELGPTNPEAHFNLGNALLARGEKNQAIEAFQEAVRLRPDYAEAHTNLGNLFLGQNLLVNAMDSFRRAIEIRPDLAEAHANLGHTLNGLGNFDKALVALESALRLNPSLAEAHNNLGTTLKGLRRLKDAAEAFRCAIKLRPNFAEAHSNLANALFLQDDLVGAIAAFDDALAISPDDLTTIRTLAGLLERANRLEDARAVIERGLAFASDDEELNLLAAKCERRNGDIQEAIERLSTIDRSGTPTRTTLNICFEMGRLHDRIGNNEEAHALFVEANELSRAYPPHGKFNKDHFLNLIASIESQLTEEWLKSWTATPALLGRETPIFFVGFPRSGTTLIEQVLASHPDLQTLDEKPVIDEMREDVNSFPKSYPAALADLTPAEIERLRANYFQTADGFLDQQSGRLIVDKMPLNVIHAALIRRIFPQAKFVLAVRHPYDVCLSCFMQNFEISSAMANFYTIEDAANLYARAMTLWQKSVRVLSLDYHAVKYEDFVDDLETQARELLRFVGVAWDASVLKFTDHAKKRARIGTISYDQVVEPIYQRARYRWKNYRNAFGASQNVLKPFAESFGYDEC